MILIKNKKTMNLVIYGPINASSAGIGDWYELMVNESKELGFPANYVGIIGSSFKSGKLMTIRRMEKKLKAALNDGEDLECLSVYSLPDGFKQAAFDYDTFMCMHREAGAMICSVPEQSFSHLDVERFINQMRKFMTCLNGEIFELAGEESSILYALKANEPSDYKSLKVLSQFEC
ncbi:hypothetical protein ACX93W_17175 [Paenibacillus sp. CAU 1782]